MYHLYPRIFPSVVVLSLFGILAARTSLVSDANSCSCWCFPYLGNVLPYSAGRDLVSFVVFCIEKLLSLYQATFFRKSCPLALLPPLLPPLHIWAASNT